MSQGDEAMKKILLAFVCLLAFTACSSTEKKGKIEYTSIAAAFEKMDNKDSFILLISKDTCSHCEEMNDMFDDTLKDHDTVIYNVKIDESSEEAYNADIAKLEERLDKPNRTPHTYYIEDGAVKDELVGFSADKPTKFWDWVKELKIENIQ